MRLVVVAAWDVWCTVNGVDHEDCPCRGVFDPPAVATASAAAR